MPLKRSACRVVLARLLQSDESYEVVRGVLDFRQHAEHWRIAGVGGEPFASLQEALKYGGFDGVLGEIQKRPIVDALNKRSIPFVTVSAALPDVDLPRVTNDFHAVGRLGGEYLLERGFRQYGFIGLAGVGSSQQMLAGFREAVEQNAGRACHTTQTLWNQTDASCLQLRGWLKTLPRPIGVMAFVDQIGRAAIREAVKAKLDVPNDIAVLGTSNHRWTTELADPPMSSVRVDHRTIGYRAAKVLDQLMAGKAPPPPQWIPPIGVVSRRSTDISVVDDATVSQALRFIRDHCQEEICVDDVLDHVAISRRNLEKRMKSAVGFTPQIAINRARIERAKKLLAQSDLTIGEVSRACAFTYQQGFVVTFKRMVGMTPGQYRRQTDG